VLARADDYADALAGAPLAARDGAPILLTGSDRLAADVEEELVRLGARTVILLGGTAALSPAVAADTAAVEGVARVERVSGANRFATAAALAETVTAVAAETSTAYLVEGLDPDPTRGWPDAVSVAGLAAFEGRPVLLTATEALPPATAEALEEGGYERVVVVGGEGAVSRSVVKEVERLGLAVERVAGGDRYATAVAIARRGLAAGMRAGRTLLATGASFSDALAAGPVAAAVGGPVVLADPLGLERTPDLARYLDDVSGGVERVRLVGGPAVLPPPFRVELERALTPLP
jgi:lactocepin